MLSLLLTGNCVYMCMYVYIYPKGWIGVAVRVFIEQGPCAAAGPEAEAEIRALASSEHWAQLLTCRADKNILSPAPANISALWPLKSGRAAHTWLLLLHAQLPLGKGEQSRAGTSPGDLHFSFADPEVREGPRALCCSGQQTQQV